ncbi:MAG: hypothetical protein P4L84_28840 [Isosphaeraceae bacterium]|nr:hypothetical protein [Isosphaeraceae bacterium]
MRLVRYLLAVVVVLLSFAFLADLGAFTTGALTADAYYLPLRSVPLGGNRAQVEDILIETHGRLLRHQRRLWLVVHGLALGCASLALAIAWRRLAQPGAAADPARGGSFW